MSKHTPGPWKIEGGTNKKGDLFVWKGGNYFGGHAIATVHGEVQEGSQANARLIAAAPKMKTVLQLAKGLLEGLDEVGTYKTGSVYDDICDVLTEAKGDSQ